jgi:hypothetical protein
MSKDTLHSLHCFMFPFRWDFICDNSNKDKQPFSKRTRLADFDKVFAKCNTLIKTPFHIGKDNKKYNEYSYFHDFARRVLYYSGKDSDNPNKFEMVYYEKNGSPTDHFLISTLKDGEFELEIESICLHAYSTGVGVLTYNLNNRNYISESDILKINDYGRRMYPQFLQKNELTKTKEAFLANKIEGRLGHITFSEDFNQYNGPINIESSFLPPDHIKKVFGFKGQEIEGTERYFVFRESHEKKGKIRISKVTDDRMFFLCWYGKEKPSKLVKHNYIKSDWWYSFIFGDKGWKTIANEKMQEKALNECTYERWSEYGTIYGMSRDSFVSLSDTLQNLTNKNIPSVYEHMRTMYYQMAVLCLAQRASVLRFSYEVSLITDILEKENNPSKKIQDLYKNYIQFINKIYFREVTSQIQGIEMYSQFQKVMNLENDVKKLDEEISELHQYVSMVEDSNLSKIALWFLPLGAIAGILGMNVFTDANFNIPKHLSEIDLKGPFWIIGSVLFSISISWFLSKYINKNVK